MTGLTNDVSYIFQVRAENNRGYSAWSESSEAVIPATVPTAPAAPTVVAGNTEADVTWVAPFDGGRDITGYEVQYAVDGVTPDWDEFDPIEIANPGTLSTVVSGLTNYTGYIFRVAATNSIGTSDFSSAPLVATPEGIEPDAPTDVTALAQVSGASVSWTAPTYDGGADLTDYKVQAYVKNGEAWDPVTPIQNVGSPVTTYSFAGLTNGEEYRFAVMAVNREGDSPESALSADSVIPADLPGAPTNVTGEAAADISGQVNLSWTAPADDGGNNIKDYVIQYTLESAPTNWATFNDDVSPATTASVTGLTNDVGYLFRVAAVNDPGQGDYSADSASITPEGVPAGPPTDVVGVYGNGQAELTWVAPLDNGGTPLTGYTIQYSDDAGLTWSDPPTPTGDLDLSYTVTDRDHGAD